MSDANTPLQSESKPKKLPKSVMMMIEKGNLVMAIKSLAKDDNISMDEAKARIDAYEALLKNQQQQQLNHIANNQGIPGSTISCDQVSPSKEGDPLVKTRVKSTPPQQDFNTLQQGLKSQLDQMGYKKPLLPYFVKRLMVIVVIVAALSYVLWQLFQ